MCAQAMLADGTRAVARRDPRRAARQPLSLHRLPAHRGRDRGRAGGRPMSDEIRTSKLDELRVVHQPLARHDAAEKIAGSTRFAGDLAYAGMLHARLVRSVVPSARLIRRDVVARGPGPGRGRRAARRGRPEQRDQRRRARPDDRGRRPEGADADPRDRAGALPRGADRAGDRRARGRARRGLRGRRGRVRGAAGDLRAGAGARPRRASRSTRAGTSSRNGASTAATSTRRSRAPTW